MGLILFRLIIIALVVIAGYFYPPFTLTRMAGAAVGLLLGVLIVLLETRVRKAQFRIIWTASIGTLLGVLAGWLLGSIYHTVVRTSEMAAFIRIFFLIAFPYIGFLVGIKKPEWLEPGFFANFSAARGRRRPTSCWIPRSSSTGGFPRSAAPALSRDTWWCPSSC